MLTCSDACDHWYMSCVDQDATRDIWLEELRRITRVLLNVEATTDDLHWAANELYALLTTVAYDAVQPPPRVERTLPTGRAISPHDAANCTRDPVRTAMFLRGVAAALGELSETFPGEIVDVVYAGTGPLAPLVLPLLACESRSRVHVTWIDINEESIVAVRRLVKRLGIGEHAFVVADAATYRHERPVRLLVCEAMQKALTVEPQVAIAINLVPQLHPRGVMVPQNVRIDLCIESATGDHCIGTLMELSELAIRERAIDERRSMTMPRMEGDVFYRTSIQTYRDHRIEFRESGLTMPEYVWELSAAAEGELITFWYEVSARPRIHYARKARGVETCTA